MPEDPRLLHRKAIADATARVRTIGSDDLRLATPCAGWNLADLLAHMIGQHRGFAAAVHAGTAPPAAYAPQPYTPERWDRSVSTLVDTFAQADLGAGVVLIEISPEPRPVAWVVAAQLLDTVVHTWDVDQALGTTYVPGAELAAAVVRGAAAVPDDERRILRGAAFAPARHTPGSDWERALAQLGRDPRPGRP